MLGFVSNFVSRFGSSKGMVAVPNLSGQTTDQAIETIRNTGLTFKQSTLRITQTQAFDKKVFNQDIAPGTLVDYESEISFSFDSYYETTTNVTYGPIESYSSTPSASCSGTTLIRTTTFLNRRKVFFEGQDQGFYKEEAATSSSTPEPNSSSCGYVPPAKVYQAGCGDFGAFSACDYTPKTNRGLRFREQTCVRTDGSTYPNRQVSACCRPGCSSVTNTFSNISTTTTTCVAVDCSETVTSKSTCRVETGTTCGPCRTRAPFSKECVKTTLNADCTTTRQPFSSTVGCNPPSRSTR